MCVVALILGMLMANMLKNVCGCNVVEGKSREFHRCIHLCYNDDNIQPGGVCYYCYSDNNNNNSTVNYDWEKQACDPKFYTDLRAEGVTPSWCTNSERTE